MSLTYYKISIIVTGVTGLLRVETLPRNTSKALQHLTFSNLVTPVTGLCARACVKKKLFNLLYTDSNFYLNRKFKKFNYYVNTEVSQIITDHCNA